MILERMEPTVSGALEWYLNGDLHRDGDLPAVLQECGKGGNTGSYIVKEETRQSECGCAVMVFTEYCVDGVCTRPPEEGPAVTSGIRHVYMVNGVKHNPYGPAVVINEYRAWWIEGKQISLNSRITGKTCGYRFLMDPQPQEDG